MTVDDVADELYSGDPAQFIGRRDDYVKQLRAAGDSTGADAVRRLRKPTVAAAALNRLARQHPDAVADLLELGTRLQAAQSSALGGGDADELRVLTTERRRAVDRLAQLAMKESHLAVTHVDAVTRTLEAAALSAGIAAALAAGRLVGEAVASGFGFELTEAAAVDISPSAPSRTPQSKPKAAEPQRPTKPAAPDRTAKPAPSRTSRQVDRLREQAARAERDAGAAQDAVESARAALDRATNEHARLEREVKTAKRLVGEARRAVQRAELLAATRAQSAWEAGERLCRAEAED